VGGAGSGAAGGAAADGGTPPPSPRTKWTRRVPHPVLIGHAASLSQAEGREANEALAAALDRERRERGTAERALRAAREAGDDTQVRLKSLQSQLAAGKAYAAKMEQEMRTKNELLAACDAKEQALQEQLRQRVESEARLQACRPGPRAPLHQPST
jgi:flagellar biosynthesis GTPase FlhF